MGTIYTTVCSNTVLVYQIYILISLVGRSNAVAVLFRDQSMGLVLICSAQDGMVLQRARLFLLMESV